MVPKAKDMRFLGQHLNLRTPSTNNTSTRCNPSAFRVAEELKGSMARPVADLIVWNMLLDKKKTQKLGLFFIL